MVHFDFFQEHHHQFHHLLIIIIIISSVMMNIAEKQLQWCKNMICSSDLFSFEKYPTCSLISLSQPIRSQQKHCRTLIGWEELFKEKNILFPYLWSLHCDLNGALMSPLGPHTAPFCDLLPSLNVNVGCSWIKWKQTYSFRTRYRNMAKQRARVGLIKEKFKLSNGLQWCEERLCARQGPGRTNQR